MHRSNSKEFTNCGKRILTVSGFIYCGQFCLSKNTPKSQETTINHTEGVFGMKTLCGPRPISIFRYLGIKIAPKETLCLPHRKSHSFPISRYSNKLAPPKARVHSCVAIRFFQIVSLQPKLFAQPPPSISPSILATHTPSISPHDVRQWRKREKTSRANGCLPMSRRKPSRKWRV